MKICKDCQEFKSRTTNWNYTHGALDPLHILVIWLGHINNLFLKKEA